MRRLTLIRLAIAFLTPSASFAQIPAPQINLTGNIGCQGFPCLNNGILNLTSDANLTLTALQTSAMYMKITSSVALTTTRTIYYPAGRFPVGIENATTGGQALNVCGPSGGCVSIPNSTTTYTPVWNDGTNFVSGSTPGTGSATILTGNQYALPQYTISPSGTTLGPSNVSVDSTGNSVNIPGSATVGPAISGFRFTMRNLSTIPANWTLDATSPATAAASLNAVSTTASTPQTMAGPLNVPSLTATTSVTTPQLTATVANGLTNAALLPGSDIGAKINSFGPNGTLFIPDGTYSFSTPISITLQGGDYLHIICASRATVLNYTGTGDAVYQTTPAGNGNTQLEMDNCTLNGTSSATNGIHFFYAQNPLLINNSINGFPGSDLLGQGVIDGIYIKNDFGSGSVPVHLEPDTTNSFASNANHFYGGSMVYGTAANFWDEGNSSIYGGDTGNTLDGVTMEMSANLPQFIVEGTWNDSIKNSYIEYISFGTSTSNLYSGIVGNYAGSGYGSNLTYNAADFEFTNNYLLTPKAGSTFTTASLLFETSSAAHIANITDVGSPTYAFSFNSSSVNSGLQIGPTGIGWQSGAYQNPPSDASLWTYGGQPTSTSGWSGTSTGRLYNAITAATLTATTSVTTPSITINGGTPITSQTGTGGTAVMSASPTLTGTPTTPTGAIQNGSTQVANDLYVDTSMAGFALSSISLNAGAGTGASASCSSTLCSDTSGWILVTTGTASTATGSLVTLNFSSSPNQLKCTVSPTTSATVGLQLWVNGGGTGVLEVATNVAPAISTAYQFMYTCR